MSVAVELADRADVVALSTAKRTRPTDRARWRRVRVLTSVALLNPPVWAFVALGPFFGVAVTLTTGIGVGMWRLHRALVAAELRRALRQADVLIGHFEFRAAEVGLVALCESALGFPQIHAQAVLRRAEVDLRCGDLERATSRARAALESSWLEEERVRALGVLAMARLASDQPIEERPAKSWPSGRLIVALELARTGVDVGEARSILSDLSERKWAGLDTFERALARASLAFLQAGSQRYRIDPTLDPANEPGAPGLGPVRRVFGLIWPQLGEWLDSSAAT